MNVFGADSVYFISLVTQSETGFHLQIPIVMQWQRCAIYQLCTCIHIDVGISNVIIKLASNTKRTRANTKGKTNLSSKC